MSKSYIKNSEVNEQKFFNYQSINFRYNIMQQIERIGQIPNTSTDSVSTLALRFSMAVFILDAMLNPYKDQKFFEETETKEMRILKSSNSDNDKILYCTKYLTSLMNLLDRLDLLLARTAIQIIDFQEKKGMGRILYDMAPINSDIDSDKVTL